MKMEIISSSFFLLILLVGIILLIIYFINPSLLGIKPNTTGGNETGGRTYQRPTIVDWGHNTPERGWYNAEGLGCYNYCRHVGDDPNIWFSCMLVDPNGTNVSPNVYTERGVYTVESLADKKCLD